MRTPIESLTEDEFLRDLVRFPFQSRFATCSCIGTWILRTFTDMLIFLLKLPLLFKSHRTDCAFTDDAREGETGTAGVV